MSEHLSALTLHRLGCGELDGEEEAAVRAHLEACETCAGRLEQRAASHASPVPEGIRQTAPDEPPPPDTGGAPAQGPLDEIESANRPWVWRTWITTVVAAAAAVIMVVLAVPDPGQSLVEAEVTQTMGGAEDVEVWRGAEGDRLQVRFRRPSAPQVVLAGVQPTGEPLIYGRWTAEMDTDRWQTAPVALDLDDAPGDEELYLLFSDRFLPDAIVGQAITDGHAPEGAQMRVVVVETAP